LRDAKESRTPYGWTVVAVPAERAHLLREGWKDVGKVFIIASILDGIYQLIVFHRVSLVGAGMVAAVPALIPYFVLRGAANRVAGARLRRSAR
jgi:hypothetical protein